MQDRALTAHRIAMEKTPTLGSKIDLVFTVIRLGLFFSDADLIARNVEKAQW
jgi:26S proteasome regulatory subunit N7